MSALKIRIGKSAFAADPASPAEAHCAPASLVSSVDHVDDRHHRVRSALAELVTADQYVAEISRLWSDAQDRFLAIGRFLIQAKDRLEHGDFTPMIRERLPFTHTVAVRLMVVARAVESGLLPADRCPRSYSVAYELASLPAAERAAAEAEGLIRQDVGRTEIVAFKRRIRSTTKDQGPAPVKTAGELRKELERLEVERHRIDGRIIELRRALEPAIPMASY